MNKKIIAGAILGIASGAAFAQSSVTIYGVLDTGITATRGVATYADPDETKFTGKKSRVGLDSGLLSSSRIGFKGTEDLGNGTAAIFNLEAGFDSSNGSQGTQGLFGRRAIVGLTNANYGTIELGRQDSVLDDTISAFDAYGNANATAASNIVKYDDRINNSVTYTTANYAGFTAKANYGFGEKAGSAADGRFYGLSLNYSNDAFAAGFAAGHSDYTGTANAATADQDVAGFVEGLGFDATKRDQYLLGASYDFGVVKPYALLSYGKTTLENAGVSKVKDKAAVLGVSAPFGASTVYASAGYVNVKPQGQKSGNAQQYTVGYTYDLSKRTTFYAAYDYIRNSSGLKDDNGVGAFQTVTEGSQVLGVGIRHKF